MPNSVIKLTRAKSVCTGAESACTATESVCTGAKSVCTGAESVCTGLKSLGTAPVSVLPPIVPAPTAESRSAGWPNPRGGGRCTGYAFSLFDRIQRVLNQRECTLALTPISFRASVRPISGRIAMPPVYSGPIDRCSDHADCRPICICGSLPRPGNGHHVFKLKFLSR